MTRIILDASTLARLNGLHDALELCNEAGTTLGYFHPHVSPPRDAAGKIISPISREEMQRRCKERGGRPLAEILADLEKL